MLLMFLVNIHGLFLGGQDSITITNAFQKMLSKSSCKPNKTWVDKGSEFFNRLIKSWL